LRLNGYLAGVYNQIKATEAPERTSFDALTEWKAGFLEDADELHLAAKPLFGSVIRAWGKDPNVRKHFVEHAAGGEARFNRLLHRFDAAYQRREWTRA
jgi:hypothetical protein